MSNNIVMCRNIRMLKPVSSLQISGDPGNDFSEGRIQNKPVEKSKSINLQSPEHTQDPSRRDSVTSNNVTSFEYIRRLTRCRGIRKKSSDKNSMSSTRLKVRTDRSAAVLVSIVILFMITHCYRLALKVYEVASPNRQTMESFQKCYALGR